MRYGTHMRPTPHPLRTTRRDWLIEGLRLLGQTGDAATLTIEAMCARMKKTKGSFYHHFSDRDAFVQDLLEYWERHYTRRIIEELEAISSPRERLLTLGRRTAEEIYLRLERAIRTWADREEAARTFVDRVDRARQDYLVEQFTAATGDPTRALLAARAHLALLVGIQMLYQDLALPELFELNEFTSQIGFLGDLPTPKEPT